MTTTTKETPKTIKATEVKADVKQQSIYQTLSSIDVSQHVEQKMGLNYLSWSWAWGLLNQHFDHVRKEAREFVLHDKSGENYIANYNSTPAGAYVEVTLTINDQEQTEILPVMDYKNKAVMQPDQMQVNKAIQRCFVKAAALFGLGLNIYAGEDLPMTKPKATQAELNTVNKLITTYSETKEQSPEKMVNWALGELNVDKFEDASKDSIKQLTITLTRALEKANGGQQ